MCSAWGGGSTDEKNMRKAHHCVEGRFLHVIQGRRRPCQLCNANEHCTIATTDDREAADAIERITLERGVFQAGESIYRMEDRFRSLFVVESGLVKVEKILEDGTNHVTGFYFSGDLFGLKSIGQLHYGYDASALETTKICEIPYSEFEELAIAVPRLGRLMITLLGDKVQQATELLFNGRQLSAERRLMRFLRYLSERNREWEYSGQGRLDLPMSKTDIASYLGVRPESVSRALSNLAKQGVIRNHPRCIEINDLAFAD
jgi:CRP/FNR family transcriptional regulator